MKDDWIEDELRQALRGRKAPDTPAFAATIAAAEQRLSGERRRLYLSGGIAAVAAIIVVSLALRSPSPDVPNAQYRIGEALLTDTGWHAPSDDWLPERQFDIYRDLPALPGSTELTQGTLL